MTAQTYMPTLQVQLREIAIALTHDSATIYDIAAMEAAADALDAAQTRIQMRLDAIREAIDLRDYDAAYALTLIPIAAKEAHP